MSTNPNRPSQITSIPEELLLSEKDQFVLENFDKISKWSADCEQELLKIGDVAEQLRVSKKYNCDQAVEVLFNSQKELWEERYRLKKQMADMAGGVAKLNREFRSTLTMLSFMRSNRVLRVLYWALFPVIKARSLYSKFSDLDKPEIAGWKELQTFINKAERLAQKKQEQNNVRSVEEEHSFLNVKNPYSAVDNSNTPLDIFKNWVSVFHVGDKMYGSKEPLISDKIEEIDKFHSLIPFVGKSVVEIGPLEAANTKQVIEYGASSVFGIEANKESYLKCLVAKSFFKLDNAEFAQGDCNQILKGKSFDICLAIGVLYHMEDPVETIEQISKVADTVYVRTHVSSDHYPEGEGVVLTDDNNRRYSGKRNYYKKSDALGGIGRYAVWLSPDAMQKAFEDRGYTLREVEHDENYKGNVIRFIAER